MDVKEWVDGKMYEDKIIRGAVCGVFGNVLKNILEFTLWKVGWLQHPLSHFATSMFMHPNHDIFFGSWLGFLMDYIYGAFLGVAFIFLLFFFGNEEWFVLTKGLLYGAFVWLFSYSGIRVLPVITLRSVGELDAVLEFLVHLTFGLGLGLALERWRRYRQPSQTASGR